MYIPVVPARGGAEVALRLYYIFLIYRTCMRRAPARPVRARFFFETVVLLSKNMTCARPRCDATPSEHFLHTSHCTLHTLHSTLHTSSHLISSELFSSHFMSSHMSAKSVLTLYFHFIWAQLNLSHLTEASLDSPRLFCTSESLRHRCIYTEESLQNTLYYKAYKSSSQYYFVLQRLHKARPSTTLYYKACTKHVPVLLCTTNLAQSTSQYYFVLQSLHKAFPSTTLHYKACTKYVPVLLCTTKLAPSTSQYYSVLQSLHKAFPSTTLYYKAYTKLFPVLLCTTKLAQSTSQYYFVLRGTFIAACSHLIRKKHKVSCSGFLPNTSPMQHSCSHYNEFCSLTWLTRISLRTWQQNVTWQQSCSHYTAICNQRFNKRIELRTPEQPHIAEH